MSSKLDFSSFTEADVLDLALLVEEESRLRYMDLAELLEEVFHNREAAAFFRAMVDFEEEHARALVRRRLAYPEAPTRVDASMLEEVDAAQVGGEARTLTAPGCLEAALAAERRAETFFRRAATACRAPEVQRLFLTLADEEVDHQRRLRDKAGELPGAGPSPY
jgi:rubrerythrin